MESSTRKPPALTVHANRADLPFGGGSSSRSWPYRSTTAAFGARGRKAGPALPAYAELIAFLELTPWEGAPYRDDKPDGNMRTMPFGKRAEGNAPVEGQGPVTAISVPPLNRVMAGEEEAVPGGAICSVYQVVVPSGDQ